MLDQNTTVVLAAIIAAAASLLGSFIGGVAFPYVTQRLAAKAERRKLVREKIEEVYTLTHEIEQWFQKQMDKQAIFLINENLKTGELASFIRPTNNINRINTLVRLYIPSLSDECEQYLNRVNDLFNVQLSSLDSEKQQNASEILNTSAAFSKSHKKIQSSLEELAQK